jgi:hypothetical protein
VGYRGWRGNGGRRRRRRGGVAGTSVATYVGMKSFTASPGCMPGWEACDVKMPLSNKDAPYASAREPAPAIGSSISAAVFTTGVSKIRVRVTPLLLGVWGTPPSARTAEGRKRGGASIARLAGVEEHSSRGREVERAIAKDRNPKMLPTGLERSTRLKVNGSFFRFLGSAVGVRSGSSSKDKSSRSMLRDGERCRREVAGNGGDDADRRRSLGRGSANSIVSFAA